MPILARDWYESKPDLTSFYQGDVILDVPVIFLPDKISKWFVLRPGNNSKLLADDVMHGKIPKWFQIMVEGTLAAADKWQPPERLEFVAATAKMMNVIILTQSCDIGNRSYYQI